MRLRLPLWVVLVIIATLAWTPSLLRAQQLPRRTLPVAPPQTGGATIMCEEGCVTYGVAVTPDSSPLTVAQNSNSSVSYTVVNTGNQTATFTLTCTGAGGVVCDSISAEAGPLLARLPSGPRNLPPALALVKCPPFCGGGGTTTTITLSGGGVAGVTAWYHVSTVVGTLTLDATSSSSTDIGSYNFSFPPVPAKAGLAFVNQNGDNIDRGACLTVGAGEDAGLSCGDLFTIKALPAYRTMGRDRSLALMYNSATSNGLVLVAANVTQPVGASVPTMVKAILTVGTAKDSAQYNPISAGATQQIVLGRGITGLATGIYNATLQVQNIYSSSVLDTTLQTTVLVVNRSASEYGKGWSLMGLEQVLTDPTLVTRRLWLSGDGSARVYYRGSTLTSGMLSHSGMTGFNASNAVDGNTSSQGWSTSTAVAGSWILADLGSAREVTTIRLFTSNDVMAARYDVQYSDNASSWRTAFDSLRPTSNGWRQVTWRSVGAHRYWRLYLTNTPGMGAGINELSFGGPNTFYGAPGDAPDSLVWSGGGYTRNLKHGTVVTFDTLGKHIRTTNRFGAYTTFNWDTLPTGQPRLMSIVIPPNDANPRPYYFYWNTSTALLDSVRDPGNRGLKTLMSSGLLTRLTDAGDLATRYSYSGTLLTKQVYVRKGMKGDSAYTTYNYANSARVTSIGIQTDSAASLFATTTVTPWDERGLGLAYGTWSSGAATSAGGLATRVDGPISGSNDASDFWVNRMGQPVTTVQVGLSARTSIWYDSAQTMPSLVTRVQYPHATTALAGGRTVYMSWNPRGNLVETRDSTCRKLAGCSPAQVDSTTYQYNNPTYAPDSPTRVIDALGRYTNYTYNSLGVVDVVTDPRGHQTKFWYKESGLFTGLVDSIAEKQVETWKSGLASDTSFVLTDQVVRFVYDNDGLVIRSTSPVGATTSFSVDPFGRTYEVYDPLRSRTRYTFDMVNRVTGMVQDSAAQNHPGGIDPLPSASCDALQILCTDPTLAPNVGPNLTTNSWYGAVGVDSIKDPRGVFRGYVYDARGNLVRELDAFRNAKRAIYDQAGLLTQTLGRVNVDYPHQDTVKYSYDGMGRLTKLWYNKSTLPYPFQADTVSRDSTRYTYDQLGQVLTAINRHGTIRRTYYADGLLRTQTAVYENRSDSASYDYDASGARSAMRRTWIPSGGLGQTDMITYGYAASGDLDSIAAAWGSPGPATPTVVKFAHDALGRRHRLEYPAGVKVHFRYDANGVLRRQKSFNPQLEWTGTPDNLEFTYRADSVDATGRAHLVQWACNLPNVGTPCGIGKTSKTISSRFNRYGWLVSQKDGSNPVEAFTYDKSGNRTSWLKSGGNRYYRYVSNLLVLDSAQSDNNHTKRLISSNANGSRVVQFRREEDEDETDEFYYYDGLGRIAGARDFHVSTGHFVDCNWYDPDGRLFSTCDALGEQRQVFDGNNVASLVDDRWVFVSGPGLDDPLFGLYRPSTGAVTNLLYYYVTDGAGRQQALARPDGSFSATDSDDYEARGGKYAGGTANAQSFNASRMEAPANAPGISYFRNRAYDQHTGRWLQEDPIGVAGGVNLYQFNGSNPVSFSDPFGLCPECKRKREEVEGPILDTDPGLADPTAWIGGLAGLGRALAGKVLVREAAVAGEKLLFEGGKDALKAALKEGIEGVNPAQGKAIGQAVKEGAVDVARIVTGENGLTTYFTRAGRSGHQTLVRMYDRSGGLTKMAQAAWDKVGKFVHGEVWK